ncbi:PD-(D/E)XK nuclease-like domain-containing protein [Desulfatitalea tepidiphila]|uniref:PD-(D/E)XK nuclease-like domain-containing protein n=1 Tax=Desulfatitalea tepidiphila TaxID=1185843 RepID=UPI0006B410C5|nr:PD-(D/E)XK nuclease-like domain-containing protein [Desulfatitalea tepidiphila]
MEAPGEWEQGIYALESYEQYAGIRALRSSELKRMRKSPAHYKAAIEFEAPVTAMQQRTFDKGKAFDILILHGREAFDKAVVVEPPINKNKNEYKEWRERQGGKLILSKIERDNVIDMAERARSKRRFSEIFEAPGFPHRVIVWKDARTGIWCKAEIDWITADGRVVDLKSTADASFWFFMRNASRLGYANQGAFYLDGLTQITGVEHTEFYLAAVEVNPPFESHVFKVSFDQVLRAQSDNMDYMEALAQCFKRDEWPGYPDEIMDLDSGQYIYDEYEETEGVDDVGF